MQPEMKDLWRQRKKESQERAKLEPTLLAGRKRKNPQFYSRNYDLCNKESLDKMSKSTGLASEGLTNTQGVM